MKSPWKATAHDQFLNKTNANMKALLGMNRFAEKKMKDMKDKIGDNIDS